jgi:hypothetical protein
MKTNFRNLALGICLACTFTSFGQEAETVVQPQRNYFYVSPVDLFFNNIELGYERMFASRNSVFLKGGIKLSKQDDYFDRQGANAEMQYRIDLRYTRNTIYTAPGRFTTYAYFAPYISYRYEQITEERTIELGVERQQVSFINAGFAGVGFGMRFTALESRFCLNLFAGGGLRYSDINGLRKYNEFLQPGYTGIAPKVSFQLGIAF